MSKTPPAPSATIREQLDRARREGRTQRALELIKELNKIEPSPEHKTLLRDIMFDRGCQLLGEGKATESRVVFHNALQQDSSPEFRARVAAKLAQLGEVKTTLAMVADLPPSDHRNKVIAAAVDSVLLKGASARTSLPDDLHAGFDAVLAAFAAVAAGNDDAARESLQAIGLSSPFLEWKVLLRGLIAFHQNEDARALENWQRLDPERQPWRLVAHYRYAIDPSFREIQPAQTRERLQRILESSTSSLIPTLRGLARDFATWDDNAKTRRALQSAAAVVQLMKTRHPANAKMLEQIIYSKIAHDGSYADVSHWRNLFEPLPDDPRANRLAALVAERNGSTPVLVTSWLSYLSDLAKLPDRFPGPANALAAALVWERIAEVMDGATDEFVNIPKDIPGPEECLRKSIELVPGRLLPYLALIVVLKKSKKNAKKVLEIAREVSAKFPDCAAGWVCLGDSTRKSAEALDAYRNAVKAEPLNEDLRYKLSFAAWKAGVAAATPSARAKKPPAPAKYRPLFEEAVRYSSISKVARQAKWAVLELKLGHPDFAEPMIVAIRQLPSHRVAAALAFYTVAQSEKKMPAELTQRFEAELRQALEQKPSPEEIVVAIEILRSYNGKPYPSVKGLVSRFFPKASNAVLESFSEAQIFRLGEALISLSLFPLAKSVAKHGESRFPKNPHFAILMVDVEMLAEKRNRYSHYNLLPRLEKARALAAKLPLEQKEAIDKKIQQREALIKPGIEDMGFFSFLNRFSPGFDDDDEDEFEDDW